MRLMGCDIWVFNQGFALMVRACYTVLIGLPVYLLPLITRIVQEERAMRAMLSSLQAPMLTTDYCLQP